MFITSSSAISYQSTFRNIGYSLKISELNANSSLLNPDYADFIPAMDRRRMSDVLKMALVSSIDCLEQAGLEQPDAIIVGTSMGCCQHTRNFLDKILYANGGLVSPTSFILSTHNTIAGQISLFLKNHEYNMTHTQNSLSFEQALIDGLLCLNDGNKNVLIGGADEVESELYNLNARLGLENIQTTCGASFFILSSQNSNNKKINLLDVGSFGLIDFPEQIMVKFLSNNCVTIDGIDLVLYCCNDQITIDKLTAMFGEKKMIDYQKITGTYFTNSALAMHLAVDTLMYAEDIPNMQSINRILVFNNLIPENLGLILLNKEFN